MADRKLTVTLVGDSKQLERTLGRTETRLQRFGRNLDAGVGGLSGRGGGLSSALLLKGGGIAIGAGIAGRELLSATQAASDLNEQVSKTKVVFDSSGAAVIAWSKTLATSFGLAQTQALQAAATFGSMFRQTGQNVQDASRLAQSVTQLGADLASFNNTTVDDALDALRSGLSGEIEPLRRFQVFLTEASVAQRAMADTGKRSSKELTQGEKIMARYELIVKATARAHGDFARTSGGLANQQRILQAQMANLETNIGQVLVPVMIEATRAANTLATTFGHLGDAAAKVGLKSKAAGFAFKHFIVPGVEGPVITGLSLINKALGDTKAKADDAAASMRKLGQTSSVFQRIVDQSRTGFDTAESRGHGAAGAANKTPPKALITQLPNRLVSQELDARLSRNQAALRAVLIQEAKVLQTALKDPRLKPGQRVDIKQALLGINDEIKGMDDAIIQAAKDKRQQAADARKKAADAAAAAKKKLAQANRDLIAKFKDQADAIKSAVLDAFDTKTDKIQNARALADAKAALRAARQIGGPQGIKLAQRDVTDAQRAIRRQQLEDTTFKVGQGPPGPVNRVTVGSVYIDVRTNDPEKAAREIVKILNRGGAGAPQSRGRRPGRQAY